MPRKTSKAAKVEKVLHLLDTRQAGGRRRKATDKYQQIVNEEHARAKEAQNRANVAALRRRQRLEEENNFHKRERTHLNAVSSSRRV
ncbi:hypothetical protein GLOTRDRAFT_134360 [Gloeophyllum trabeum ATCC 11539]|uniref:Uncharacterized protein n=1 Tax=Gloeophyllum trabeum (strain ATCC 11539 / FP-39264 / Madison 617) TaxID=670483 RepID=S7RCA3_GLOTA|nr:uncharacterized protein GLOTRDRAFT_134360 [Gloeophyllum trabeum ATCC 11539]EPQ49999.1 hypothetical protein GLOTRDRAFT_134360 [Gloeophyllum trabeum ATCC 11539]